MVASRRLSACGFLFSSAPRAPLALRPTPRCGDDECSSRLQQLQCVQAVAYMQVAGNRSESVASSRSLDIQEPVASLAQWQGAGAGY